MSSFLLHARFRLISGFILILCCACMMAPELGQAQDTTIYVSIRDTFAYPGQEVHLPVVITNLRDSIEGYQVQYVVDRPNMIFFPDTTVVETLIVCANPPACTVMDTIIDTVSRTPIDTQGTLTNGWEVAAGQNFGLPTVVLVTAISDWTGDNKPPGIPPSTTGATLVKLVAFVYCPPDPFGGGLVQLMPTAFNFDFSDPLGQLITPVSKRGGTIRILDPVPGDFDYSGWADVNDVIRMIGYAFMGRSLPCAAIKTDFNCDQKTDVNDVISLIRLVFLNAPPSGC